jgi:hypothetical protein
METGNKTWSVSKSCPFTISTIGNHVIVNKPAVTLDFDAFALGAGPHY